MKVTLDGLLLEKVPFYDIMDESLSIQVDSAVASVKEDSIHILFSSLYSSCVVEDIVSSTT